MQNKKKTSEYSKMIELQDEIEGECINNTDFYFDQISEPFPIKPSNFDPIFDLQAFLSQPLTVSELHRLIFVMHSDGFCIAKTKDTIDSARTNRRSAKEKKKKKRKKESSGTFWSLKEWQGKKKEGRRIKKKKKK